MKTTITDCQTGENPQRLVFREPRNADELRRLLELRYGVYRDSRLAAFCPENSSHIDVTPHDARSLHFGLFIEQGEASEPIGYMRVIGYDDAPSIDCMRALARVDRCIGEALNGETADPLPLLGYGKEGEVVRHLHDECAAHGGRIVEPGRLSLRREHRSLTTVAHLVKSVIAVLSNGIYRCDHAFLTCNTSHRRFYQALGFHRIPGTSNEFWIKEHARGCALEGSPESITASFHEELNRMAGQFYNSGEIETACRARRDSDIAASAILGTARRRCAA